MHTACRFALDCVHVATIKSMYAAEFTLCRFVRFHSLRFQLIGKRGFVLKCSLITRPITPV